MSVPLNIGEATGKTNGAERSHCKLLLVRVVGMLSKLAK